jgi:iron complex outermembrane receptor protein
MQAEVGLKALFGDDAHLEIALFQIDTEDEIVVAESQGGRTSYRNAGETRRRGLELALEGSLAERLNARLALTALDARYSTEFETRSGGAPVTVPAGNRLPGVPELSANLAIGWEPRDGLKLGAEIDHRGKVYVEDLNQAPPAPARTLVNLHLAAEQRHGNWTFNQLLRVDNLFDTDHVGSVIVGSAGGRYYEPGPGRSWYAGVSAAYRF